MRLTNSVLHKGTAVFVMVWLSLLSPALALAQDAIDATGNSTGAPENTGAPACTGAGCGQGAGQGAGQGGPSLEDLGATTDESGNTVLPDGVDDTRQGASNGSGQGAGNGIAAENSNTGAGSDNTAAVDSNASTNNSVSNSATDTTNAAVTAGTGNNTQNKNTGAGGITTGNAGIGVTQVKNDNTTTINGTAGLNVSGHNGNYDGDLALGFGFGSGLLSGPNGPASIRAINDTTGSDSDNDIDIDTKTERLDEVQNDGKINNLLDLAAVTGRNEASKNTGDGSITTGDANVAATLVNLLNTTVIDGNLWISVADIFGDLNGNIVLPDFTALAALLPNGGLAIDTVNEETGADSTNTIDVDVTDEKITAVDNDANITTTVDAKAITGQNETLANTGGGQIETGDAKVSASNISLANTTIEGGNWGLVIVNALNRWLGFLVGDNGEVRALSQDETIREIEARNSATGSDSDNTIDVDVANRNERTVTNDAEINNEVTASAITGQNEASKNTGQGKIATGDANIEATAVNIANTTVIGGSLFVAVVNVFGDWFGDLLYGGAPLAATQAAGPGGTVAVHAENFDTGADSDNTIDVDVTRRQETTVDNEADVRTTLNAEVDTGSNRASRNTLGGDITTGDGLLALHSRTLANLTGIALSPALGLTISGLNDTTGFDSKNTIRARLNDERIVTVDNDANVSTIFAGAANTGNNEANQNTVGGNIFTGDATASAAIHNLVNRVLLALVDGGIAAGDVIGVDADLINRLTGALSENENEVEANYDFLADIMNRGLVDNIINLLLNTGGNTANENTNGGSIVTGGGCFDGDVVNSVNTNSLTGLGGWSLDLINTALVNNAAALGITTGDNEANRNTGGGLDLGGAEGACAKLALAPEDPGHDEDADEGSGDTGDAGGGTGGGDVGPDPAEPRVAGAVDEEAGQPAGRIGTGAGGGILTRFPVAGAAGEALLLPNAKHSPWAAFALISTVLVLAAYGIDTQHRQTAPRRSTE
jgi:hypothetical protein